MRNVTITMAAIAAVVLFWASYVAAQGQSPGQGRGAMMFERIEMIDADGDGLVQQSELTAWRESVFYAMDADGDGALTREEYMAVQLGRGADPAARGPRYAEMQAKKAAEFDAIDNDGDHVVAQEPFIAYAATVLDQADADNDGALSPIEFRSMHRAR